MAEQKSSVIPEMATGGVEVEELLFDPAEVRSDNQRGNEITVGQYARAVASALVAKMLMEVSSANNSTAVRPTHVIPAVHPADKNLVLLVPVHSGDSPSARKILYHRSSFQINLRAVFKGLNRLPVPGYRDIYTVTRTKEPIKLGNLTGHALVIKVDQKVSEQIQVSEITRMKRQTAALVREAAAIERKARHAQVKREAQAKVAAAEELLPKD